MHYNSPNKLLVSLLGFKNLLVKHYDLRPRKRVLHLWVKPRGCGARCPECGRRCKLQRRGPAGPARAMRTWRDLPAGGLAVALHYRPREVVCPAHGRRQEEVPWAAPNARNTLRLECELLRLCKQMTQKEAAARLGLPASTAAGVLHRVVARCRGGHRIRGLKNLGIDEISYKKRHRYLTVVYDLDRRCVVWTGEGKGRETADRFFTTALSAGQRSRVLTACCDMSKAYTAAIAHHLPKALLVLDRFHIAKALNEAVDEVRKAAWRTAGAAGRATLKGLRFTLLKARKNRTHAERRALASIATSNRRLFRATVLKDELSRLWEYRSPIFAERYLRLWCKRALLSRVEPLRRFVSTLRRHWDGVLASITGITNAASEGINRLLRLAKNRASGFRSTASFSNMIFLVAGDLDLPAQISAQNRPRQTKPLYHAQLCL